MNLICPGVMRNSGCDFSWPFILLHIQIVFRVRGSFFVLKNHCHHNNDIIEYVSHLHAMLSSWLSMSCIHTLYGRPMSKSPQEVAHFFSGLYGFSLCILCDRITTSTRSLVYDSQYSSPNTTLTNQALNAT